MGNQQKSIEQHLKELQENYNSLKDLCDTVNTEHIQMKAEHDKMGSLAKIGSWEYNMQLFKFSCSKEVYKIFELTVEIELSLDEVLKYFDDESSGIIHRAIKLAIKEGKSFIRDSEIITASGMHKWIRIQGVVIEKSSTKPRHIFGTIQDISEIRLLDHVTQKSVLTLDQVEQLTHIGHWSVNMINGSFYHSDEIKRIFGYEPSEYALSVEEAINAYHPDDRDDVIKYFNRAAETGEGYEFDLRVIQPGGNIRNVHSKGYTEKNEDGKVISVYGVFQDITESKQTEQEFRNAKEKAEESELQFRNLFENAADAIFIAEEHSGIILDLNQSAEKLMQMDRNELIGLHQSKLHPPEAYEYSVDTFSEHRNQLGAWKKTYSVDNIIVRKDGSQASVEILATKVIYKGKKSVVGTFRDVTQRKQAEKELIKAKEKAEESDRLKSAFLANMSHEIRTPMNGILGFANLLQKPKLTGNEQQRYISIIEKSGERMLNIINDIIDISKIEAGLMEFNMTEANINGQIDYIYTFFKVEAETKAIKLSYKTSLTTKEATILTDKEKLYAILTNLVKNAIKYTEKGSIEFGYILKTDNATKALEFYVKDSGMGIPKDRQKAIFERFIQSDIDNKMAHQGAGLGLAITKTYVERLGGQIWVESEDGKGSTFYFTLPYNTKLSTETNNILSEFSEENDDTRKLIILIAEDDEVSEMLLSATVETYSKEILKAGTGVEAIEACRNNSDIDLILMDIRMPEINGYEATKQIRKFNKEVIIIAQTAYGLSTDREKAIESGCNDYIAKPINMMELQALVTKYFGK